MKIAQLRDVLEAFAHLHAGNGAVDKSEALRRFGSALKPHDKRTVKAFVKTTRAKVSD